MTPNSVYTYTSITAPRTIRLLHLQPGNGIDPIQFSLTVVTLDSNPEYEAISYCWGNENDRYEVVCDGAILSVTNSLFTGLWQFRRSDQVRTLWADAVCINQSNPIEKTEQVLLMPGIYSQATRVLVWLGATDDLVYGSVPRTVAGSVREAMSMMPENVNLDDKQGIAEKIQALPSDAQRLREEGKPNLLDHDWRPLVALLSRPWFTRKWVLQEVLLGRQVRLYVGDQVELDWEGLPKLLFDMTSLSMNEYVRMQVTKAHEHSQKESLITHQGAERDNTRFQLQAFLRATYCLISFHMIQLFRQSGTLLDGLLITQRSQCTDPRDHIYSLLSLVTASLTIQPDYEATTGEVFHRFAITMMEEGQSLKVLNLAPDKHITYAPSAQRLEGLPSWVSDLRDMEAIILVNYSVRQQTFFAGGTDKPVLNISKNRRLLSCKGRVVDTVEKFHPSLREMMLVDIPQVRQGKLEDLYDALPDRKIKRSVEWLKGSYHLAFNCDYDDENRVRSTEEAMYSFSRTLMCGIDVLRNRISPEYVAAVPLWMKHKIESAASNTDESLQDSAFTSGLSTALDDFIESFGVMFKFCCTEKGRFGQIPIPSRLGDMICVLVGGETPFVIRPTGRGTYTLVGECYIDGIMDGEGLDAAVSESLETIHLE